MATFYTDADLAGAGEFSDPELTLATEYTIQDGNINFLRWRCPSVAPSVTPAFRIYDASNNLVATVALDGAVTTSAWNIGTPVAPIALSAGTYRASINTTEYLARSGFFNSGPIVRGDITAVQGRFANGIAAPGGASNSAYFVDIDFGDAAPALGSADVGLDIDVAAAGASRSAGTAATVVDLAGAVSGSRVSEGAASVSLALDVAAAGARTSGGVAATGLALDVTVSGARRAAGAAAVSLVIDVAARSGTPGTGGPRLVTYTDGGRLVSLARPDVLITRG